MEFPSGSGGGQKAVVLWLLGLGFWVQGFRVFPWMGVRFFLKDDLDVSPSTLEILYNFADLPMIGKPLYGVISDAVYIGDAHRLPYLAIGAMLQVVSWLSIVLLKHTSFSIYTFSVFLFMGNFGASISEVMNDAIVAEAGKQGGGTAAQLQSFGWTISSAAAALGYLLGGASVNEVASASMFLVFVLLLTVQLFITVIVPESALGLPPPRRPRPSAALPSARWHLSVKRQLVHLYSALRTPEILSSVAWLATAFAAMPAMGGIMFYYNTQHLGVDPSVIGLSEVFGQVCVLAWSVLYKRWLKDLPPRTLLFALQSASVAVTLSNLLFILRLYSTAGVPDSVYIVVALGMSKSLFQAKILPFSVLMAELCPVGCEGSLMAFVMSVAALADIVSGFWGVTLQRVFGVTTGDFSRLTLVTAVRAACCALPLFLTSWIASDGRGEFAQFKIK